MAILQYCLKCQENTYHNNPGQCLKCRERQTKLNLEKSFQEWKKDKSIEEQIKDLYFIINYNNKNDSDKLFG